MCADGALRRININLGRAERIPVGQDTEAITATAGAVVYQSRTSDNLVVRSGKRTIKVPTGETPLEFELVAVSKAGKRVAFMTRTVDELNEIEIWELIGEPRLLGRYALPPPLRKLYDQKRSALFSPDGDTLAVNAGERIVLLDAVTAHPMINLQPPGGVGHMMAFSHTGQLVAAGLAGRVHLWDGSPPKNQSAAAIQLGHQTPPHLKP